LSIEPTPRPDAVRAAGGDPGDAWIGAARLRSVASFGVRAAILAGLALGAAATAAGTVGTASSVSLPAPPPGTGCCPPGP
jgi:hypothetical protein